MGEVDDIWFTRNMGSIYASCLLIFTVYGGIVWLQVINSLKYVIILSLFVLLSLILSMSRSALIPLIMLFIFYLSITKCNRNLQMQYFIFYSFIFIILIAFYYFFTIPDSNDDLISAWNNRFQGIGDSSLNWFISNYERRTSEFIHIYKTVFKDNLIVGVGFGQYFFASQTEYSDAHNMFITESFENGLLSTLFLYLPFVIGLIVSFRYLRNFKLMPISISYIFTMVLTHVGGLTLSERSNPSQYFTPYGAWMMFFILGFLISRPMRKINFISDISKKILSDVS